MTRRREAEEAFEKDRAVSSVLERRGATGSTASKTKKSESWLCWTAAFPVVGKKRLRGLSPGGKGTFNLHVL